jgi:hypothetical protein
MWTQLLASLRYQCTLGLFAFLRIEAFSAVTISPFETHTVSLTTDQYNHLNVQLALNNNRLTAGTLLSSQSDTDMGEHMG